ncbi:hypothetical protein RvY_01711 [Ramazzottius varieornatus]|uniref:Uncharacterized protein n=1 Tax=Ramazzottius varieornatus TaxID=947166 RepID=A0A1D1URZ0_RAMVA|nr:hypothetical protein RvY_01711 [Ramazzottius varieornatus]
MSGAYAPYQMPGLTTGFPMGFPLGSPFGLSLSHSMGMPLLGTLAQPRLTADEWLILQGMTASQLVTAATQPAVPSISPGAPAIQPSNHRVPQASCYHASAATSSPVTHRASPSITVASAVNRLTNITQTETEVETTVGVAMLVAALTNAMVVVEAVMALDGAVNVAVVDNEEIALEAVGTREVDVIVADKG